MERIHRTVFPKETIEFLQVSKGGVYLDGTFGEGGHTGEILRCGAGRVLGVDQDASALARYQADGEFAQDPRLELHHGPLTQVVSRLDAKVQLQGALTDLGVSTRQLLEGERGFSFNQAGPLDMRMNAKEGETLLEKLQTVEHEDLANVLWRYGQIRASYKIARRILEKLHAGELQTTADLATVCGPRTAKSHPATSLFLALRMWVNREWEEVEQGLPLLFERLAPGGRLVVLTFHSVEDGLVKRIFKQFAGRCVCDEPICRCPKQPQAHLVTPKPLVPSEEELAVNPRARSAKLRCIEKI